MHYYIFSKRTSSPILFYERTTSTLQSADEWVRTYTERYGEGAKWMLDELPSEGYWY